MLGRLNKNFLDIRKNYDTNRLQQSRRAACICMHLPSRAILHRVSIITIHVTGAPTHPSIHRRRFYESRHVTAYTPPYLYYITLTFTLLPALTTGPPVHVTKFTTFLWDFLSLLQYTVSTSRIWGSCRMQTLSVIHYNNDRSRTWKRGQQVAHGSNKWAGTHSDASSSALSDGEISTTNENHTHALRSVVCILKCVCVCVWELNWARFNVPPNTL